MQSDQQKNYWEKDPEEPGLNSNIEMYAPEPEQDDVDQDDSKYIRKSKDELSDDADAVHWTASEYIDNEKGALWYVVFGLVVAILITADIIFMKSYTFSALVVVMALAVVVLSRRSPRDINYTLSGGQGLYIGEKLHHFSEFKAFGLINDDGNQSIMLIPIKRFSLGVSVYFPKESGEQIVDILGARLPMQEFKMDIIDKLVRVLRL
jgi:hypothetical protein